MHLAELSLLKQRNNANEREGLKRTNWIREDKKRERKEVMMKAVVVSVRADYGRHSKCYISSLSLFHLIILHFALANYWSYQGYCRNSSDTLESFI